MSAGVPEQLPGGAGGAAVGVVAGGGRGARQRAERVRQLHQAGAAPAPGRAARARARELRLAPRAAARPRPHGAAQPLRRPARRGTLPIPYTIPYLTSASGLCGSLVRDSLFYCTGQIYIK